MSGKVGSRGRLLAIAAVEGLGIEGAGDLAPGLLSDSHIQATREHGQFGFGAYDIPNTISPATQILDGQAGGSIILTNGTGLVGSTGIDNRQLETRILAADIRLDVDAAGAAALVAAGAHVLVRFSMGRGATGVTLAAIMQLQAPFGAGQLQYRWSMHGGGLVVLGGGDWRLGNCFQGWVPAGATCTWAVSTTVGVFPANSTLNGAHLLATQPRFNRVPL